jgi:peptidyl-prolyl cis-trans isomerase D
VLRVDKITPSVLRPLAEVRDVVASAWRGEQRHQAAKARAEAIAQKIQGGKPLADAVAEFDLKVKSAGPFKRDEHEALPADVVKALFAAKTGEGAVGEDKDGYVVAQLRDIAPADPAADKDGVAAVQQQLDGAFGTDFLVQYGGGIEKRYPIKFNAKNFDALFAGS